MRLRRYAGRVSERITCASDAWLAARILAWACVIPAIKHVVPVKSLGSMMHCGPRVGHRDSRREDCIVTFARWAARAMRWSSGGNCLDRGLIAYRYLGAAGADPTLMVGIGRDDRGRVIGHAWVLLDGRPVGENESAVRSYTPVLAFAPDGSCLGAPAAIAPIDASAR